MRGVVQLTCRNPDGMIFKVLRSTKDTMSHKDHNVVFFVVHCVLCAPTDRKIKESPEGDSL
jgi:hypothetical protein